MQDKAREILQKVKSIAVVGLSPDENKPSHYVSKFLQSKGYEIFPIYPKEIELLGKKATQSLEQLQINPDLVLMFRKGEFASELLPIIKQRGIKNFWLQLGIKNEAVRLECEKAGINFVEDKCAKIELEKLLKLDS